MRSRHDARFLGLPFGPEGEREKASPPAARSSRPERWMLRKLFEAMGGPPVRVILWDGDTAYAPSGPATATLVIHDRRTLLGLIADPELRLGDAFSEGAITIEGDLVGCLESVYRTRPCGGIAAALLERWQSRQAHSNTLARSRENIHHHYDLGNDFYRLWLDQRLLYSCAYFPAPETSLEEAQVAKMEHVCRKVALRPEERVVEAGCGWGALALYMAKRHGVSVRAFNISREQIEFAREEARQQGLSNRVEFVEDDYRNISGTFDAFVSVGMLEHVGRAHYGELGRVIDRCLTPVGRGLIHSIGRNRPQPMNRWIERRIFPGAYPPTLREMMDVVEPFEFSVLDVENLRLHYAKTLEHWLERYERAAERAREMFDPAFVRAWRLYLAGSLVAFRTGTLQLFQLVFARGESNRIPWSRAHVYDPPSGA